jgi:preprotein translocase subunit YajC
MYLFGQAAGGGTQPAPNLIGALFPFILIFVIFYFIIIMPARKKQKQHQNMLSNLKGGERVISTGGIFGTIKRVMDDRFEVEVGKGVIMQFTKSAISTVVGPDGAEVKDVKDK